uniref:Uncharacterized protein n=1 Tax=Eutreptiella gymnastica TaxID=73025 RepID=A0A7S4FXB6_9EUGL
MPTGFSVRHQKQVTVTGNFNRAPRSSSSPTGGHGLDGMVRCIRCSDAAGSRPATFLFRIALQCGMVPALWSLSGVRCSSTAAVAFRGSGHVFGNVGPAAGPLLLEVCRGFSHGPTLCFLRGSPPPSTMAPSGAHCW